MNDKWKVLKWTKRIALLVVILIGFLYLFFEFYVPQKMKQYDKIVERTRQDLSLTGSVSATILPGSEQFDPQVHRAYLKEKNYPKTFLLLEKKIDSDEATIGDGQVVDRGVKVGFQ